MSDRSPVTTLEELDRLDETEMVEGYLDGFNGGSEPGGNHSKAYWHGWRNGASDRSGTSDSAQQRLSHLIVERGRSTLHPSSR